MKVTLLVSFLLAIGASCVNSQQCHLREIDLCLSTGMLHYQSNGMPEDDAKVTEWCDVVKELRECMSDYGQKCMSPIQRELGQLLGGGASNAEVELCTAGSELRNRYLKHARCLSENADSESFKAIGRDLQVAIETIPEVKFRDRFPVLCCGSLRFHREAEENTRRNCGDDAVEMLRIIMDMVFTDLPKTICQSIDDRSDTCKQLLPPPGTTPQGSQSKSQIAKLMSTMFGN